MTSVLGRILPDVVAVAETFTDPSDAELEAGLVGPEHQMVATASPKRRREFAAARICARRAMRDLGVPEAPVVKGERGVPVWPSGVVGTMTHTEGYRAAALAHAAELRAVGVDAEPHDVLPDGVLDAVTLPEERGWLRAAAFDPAASSLRLDRLLFCAKEATYKAWFPLTRRWLGFEDAHITIGVGAGDAPEGDALGYGTFRSRILIDPHVIDGGAPLTEISGRWIVADGFVLAAAVVRR